MYQHFMTKLVFSVLAVICLGSGFDRAKAKEVDNLGLDRDNREVPVSQLDDQVPPFDLQETQGILTAVAPEYQQVTVKRIQGPMLFSLTPTTKIILGTVEGTMANLRPGLKVRVLYLKRENLNVAQSIRVETRLFSDIAKASSWFPYALR
jgi:hypothetical protein